MSSTAAASKTHGRIVTQKTADKKQAPGTPGTTKRTVAANSKQPRASDQRSRADSLSRRRNMKISMTSVSDAHSTTTAARKRLIRIFNMVRSFVRFTGAKKRQEQEPDEDSEYFKAKQEATFKTEPDITLIPSRIELHVREGVAEMLKGYEYDANSGSKYSRALAAVVADTMKRLELPRYRYVVNVTVGEVTGQGIGLTSRCLWDEKRDNYVTVNFTGKNYFAVITVHAVYTD